MEEVKIECKIRDDLKKSKTEDYRKQGLIPAVVYGHGVNKNLVVNNKAFLNAIHTHAGMNVIIDLEVDGQTDKVIVKEVQRYPLDDSIIHVDFQRVTLTEKIEVMVPLHVRGEAVGVKEKDGVLEHLVREVKVKCLASEIPEELIIDVSALDIGEGATLKNVSMPDNIEVLMDMSTVVVNVVAPTMEVAASAPVEGEAAAEPEVIAKGKEAEGEEGKEGKEAKESKESKESKEAKAPKKEPKKE